MLRQVSDKRAERRGSPWWRQAATVISVTGLFVTLVFNTLAVRRSAEQDNGARDAAQVGLLTQLNATASASENAINETSAPDKRCGPPEPLGSRGDDAALRGALDYYEYLSWLFNHRRLTVSDSRAFFAERMIDGWRLGRHFLGQDEMRLRYRELDRFAHATPRTQRGEDPCAGR
jgi:hypothetical protein